MNVVNPFGCNVRISYRHPEVHAFAAAVADEVNIVAIPHRGTRCPPLRCRNIRRCVAAEVVQVDHRPPSAAVPFPVTKGLGDEGDHFFRRANRNRIRHRRRVFIRGPHRGADGEELVETVTPAFPA